ncbi:hypothetical protein DV495_000493 [Geotrichum candidum]|nr:hypothetical protein DV452_003209 [Geotrichum candidum]KAI9213259.1 hypothetical protein DS838_001830 [Geotrichum bryndzae]KAF5117139.1 hypothetical protein DV454_001292 [Geotrichum candidum]KAF5135745.1 hypothetical protein DV495_000493 [Geotrichum candidum]KAF7499762.1 hypothetical protein DV113_002197 [Geotrichum candidum]
MVDVDLGPVKAISRRHAKIFYNFGTQRFELSVLGRNGAFVDDSFVDTGSTVPLQNGDSTQIGSEANKQSSQGPSLTKDIKTESKPVPKPPTKKQSTRREYLPEEIPEEYREKPAFSYSHLIATALRAHPEASGISLSEIYKSIQDIFPYYKYCPHGWQNSVRHNLSSNKAFRKISKEGKGWLWGIDEEYFQERERLKKKAAVSLKAKTAAVVSTTTKGKQLLNEKDSQQEQQQIDQLSYQQSQLHYQQQTQQFHQQNQQFQQQLQAQAQNKSSSTGLSDPSTFIPSFYTDHKNTTHRTPHVLETAPIPFSSIPPSISNPTNLPPEALADLNSVYDREFAQKQNKHQQQQQQANDSSSTSESNPVSTFSLNPVPTTVAALSKPTTPVSASAPVKKERAKTIAELASEIQIDSSNDRLYRPDYANGSRESLTERKKSAPSSDVTVTAVTSAKPTPATSSSTSIHMMPAVATNSIAQNDAILNSPRYQQYYANSALTPPVPSTRVTNAISGFISSSQASPASVSSPAGSSSNPARGQGSVQSMAAGQNTFRMTQAPKLSGPPSQATQSQLQMQTSVPQMRVNPQIPQGVRDPKASGTSASLSPVAATAGSPGVSTTSGSPVPSTGNWQSQSRTGKSVSPPAPSVASSPSVSSIPVTNATAAAATSSAASKPVAKTNVASSASSGTGTAARKPAVNANLSNLNLPKETLRILTLLQDKIKAQMEASGQVINSALLTNALAIAISQLTKNSGSGGGAAAITNLLKGKNQAQLVNALATAISSAKKTGGPSGSSSSTHGTKPKPVNPLATTSSSVPKPAPASAPMIPGLSKLHPPVTVPAAISSPASLNAGLPPHLSGITAKVPLSNMVPRVKQAQSPVPPPAGPAKSASNVDEKKSSPVLSRPTSAPASGITKPLPGFDTNKAQVPSLNKSGPSTAASKHPAYASEPMPPKITMPVPPAIRAALAAAAAASSASVKTSKSMSEPAPVKAATATSPVNASSPALGALSEGSKPKRPAPEQIQSPAIKKEKTEAGAVTVKSVEPSKSAAAPGSTLKHVPAAAASASAATLPAKSASPPPNPPAKPSAPLPATAPAAPQAATKPSAQQSPAPAKSKAEMISEMLAKASKLTNPTPSIKAALLQLQAHATKLGLPIPENLKRILNDDTPAAPPSGAPADAGADKKRKATPDGPSTVQNPKIQKTS